MDDYFNSLGYKFLQGTKLSPSSLFKREKEYIMPSSYFKEYPNAPKFSLPQPKFLPKNFWEILIKRRSEREYQKDPISLQELSLLCFATQGITGKIGSYLLRTAPSAGALYPIETYIVVNNVEALNPGIYHLNIKDFGLEQLVEGNLGRELKEACIYQEHCESAAVVFIWSGVFRRTMSKYGSRGMRYVFMDVAHICQNLLLACEALDLSACPVAAFFDDALNQLIGLDGKEESVIYLATIGRRIWKF